MSGRHSSRTLIAVVIVLALGAAVWLAAAALRPGGDSKHARAKDSTKPGEHAEKAGPLKLSEQERARLGLQIITIEPRVPEESLVVTGKIGPNPDRTVVIAARAPGRIVKVMAQLGDTVEAGAPLALIDSVEAADALAELTQADAALALTQAKAEQEKRVYDAKLRVIDTARQQSTAEAALTALRGAELGRAKQEYISALAKRELAQAEYDREALLVEKKIGARKDLVRAEKDLLAAKSEVEAVGETIALSAKQDLLAAEAAVQQARAQRDRAREKLRLLGFTDAALAGAAGRPAGQRSLTPLVAPFRGTVIERQVTEGQLVDGSATPFRLADLTVVWALLDVPEADAQAIRVGQAVTIETGGERSIRYAGRVVYVADVVDEQTRTVKVRVEIPNPQRHFRPGMFITARITTGATAAPALMVPKTAVFVMDEGSVVFVETPQGFLARPVQHGPETGGWVPIRSGLAAGERVVSDGGFALKAQLVKAKMGQE